MKRVIRVAINGCDGRMGTRVHALAQHDDQFEVAALIGRGGVTWCSDERAIDAVIDFSNDIGARDACDFAVDHRASLLVATTALSDETRAAIDDAAGSIPVIVAANTSYGVAVVGLMSRLSRRITFGSAIGRPERRCDLPNQSPM